MAERMKLARFCDYLRERHQAITAVHRELEEIQVQFNREHHETMQEWQAAMGQAVPLLTAPDASLPPALAQSLLEAVHQERARLEEEIAGLTTQVQQKRAEGDQALRDAQAQEAALRRLNPQLDAQEEELKARCAALQQQIRDLNAQIQRTGLLSFLARHRLRRERRAQTAALTTELGRLRSVRQQWVDERKRQQEDQAQLHGIWDAATIEAAQVQARVDYLQANLERLSLQNGAANLLAGLQAVPEAPEPLRPALAKMVELNRVKADYEAGLRTVAGALGLLKGLADGMERFRRSADKVLEEQRQYNLRELRIELSDPILQSHALWPEFFKQVRDEKSLGAHPAEFSRRVETIIRERLTEQSIAAVFDGMGEALQEATKAWG